MRGVSSYRASCACGHVRALVYIIRSLHGVDDAMVRNVPGPGARSFGVYSLETRRSRCHFTRFPLAELLMRRCRRTRNCVATKSFGPAARNMARGRKWSLALPKNNRRRSWISWMGDALTPNALKLRLCLIQATSCRRLERGRTAKQPPWPYETARRLLWPLWPLWPLCIQLVRGQLVRDLP